MSVTIQHGVIQMTAANDAIPGRATPPNTAVNPDGSWVVNPANQINPCQMRVNSIVIDPSSTAWAVTLTGFTSSNAVFSAEGSTQATFYAEGPYDFNGIVLKTATNITRITMTFDYIQW